MNKHNTLLAVWLFAAAAASAKEGVYVAYNVTSANTQGANKTWVAGGDVRSEVAMQGPTAPGAPPVVTLTLHNKPDKVYMMTGTDKSYAELKVRKTDGVPQPEDSYDVTVLGKEDMNGYKSTHVRVTNKRTKRVSDLWVSADVKGYADYTGVQMQYFGGTEFYNKLKQKGVEGLVVRMESTTEDGAGMQMQLAAVEKKDLPDELFSLKGYTRGASYDMSKTEEELKNMTPAERRAYTDQVAK